MGSSVQKLTCRLLAVAFDAHDPARLAGFWALTSARSTDDFAVRGRSIPVGHEATSHKEQ